MLDISFNSLLIIAGVAVLVPVVLDLLPKLPVPEAALEVIAGIVVGPSVPGWVRADDIASYKPPPTPLFH